MVTYLSEKLIFPTRGENTYGALYPQYNISPTLGKQFGLEWKQRPLDSTFSPPL